MTNRLDLELIPRQKLSIHLSQHLSFHLIIAF